MAADQPGSNGFFARHRRWVTGSAVALGIGMIAALALVVYLFVLRGNVQVTALSLSSNRIVSGEPVHATITIENERLLTTPYQPVLTVDGQRHTLTELKAEHSAPQSVSFDLSELLPGQHTVQIGSFSRQLTILRPAKLEVASLVLDGSKIMVGGAITAQAVIRNTGEAEGTFTSKFTCDGAAVDTPAVTVKPGAVETIEVKLSAKARGVHEIALDGWKQTFTALTPANMAIVDLKLTKNYAGTNESVAFSVTVANTGDVAGTCQVPFIVNDKPQGSQSVSVGANAKSVSTFMLVEGKPGKYVLKTGSFSKTLSVIAAIHPASGSLLVNKANGGSGKLTLINGSKDQDAIFVLTSTADPKTPVLTVFVTAGSKVTGIKVKDGSYNVFYTTGTSYSPTAKRFIYTSAVKRITAPLLFETTGHGRRKHGSVCTVTIDTTGGSPNSVPIKSVDFPD